MCAGVSTAPQNHAETRIAVPRGHLVAAGEPGYDGCCHRRREDACSHACPESCSSRSRPSGPRPRLPAVARGRPTAASSRARRAGDSCGSSRARRAVGTPSASSPGTSAAPQVSPGRRDHRGQRVLKGHKDQPVPRVSKACRASGAPREIREHREHRELKARRARPGLHRSRHSQARPAHGRTARQARSKSQLPRRT